MQKKIVREVWSKNIGFVDVPGFDQLMEGSVNEVMWGPLTSNKPLLNRFAPVINLNPQLVD